MLEDKNKIALSFDVELWNEGEWLKPFIAPEMLSVDTFPASMEKILNLLREKGSATFFVTEKVTQKYPEIIKKISEDGHEIGIHGPKHKKLKDYTPEEFKNDSINQIKLLENITGKKPIGYRAPHFSLSKETYWVLEILKELEFKYDSSVFPVGMGEYGSSKSPLVTYEIIPNLLEIPISVASFGKIRIPFAGGIYFRILPLFIFKWLLKVSSKNSTPVIYFHPHELDGSTPQIKRGPFLKRLLKYWGVKRSFKKLKKISNSYYFLSIDKTFKK